MSASGYAQAGRDSQLGAKQAREGMYGHSATAVSRICILNNRIGDLLARVRGSQPSPISSDSNTTQPATLLQVGLNLHSEIDLMDKQLSELGELIG